SHDIYAPWPEEINRKLTDGICDLYFAPTVTSKQNLLREGVVARHIYVTGNSVIDALLHTVSKIKQNTSLQQQLAQRFPYLDSTKKLILVTGHRRENFGDGFLQICKALTEIVARDDVQIIYPVHLNPNVTQPVTNLLSNHPNIFLI